MKQVVRVMALAALAYCAAAAPGCGGNGEKVEIDASGDPYKPDVPPGMEQGAMGLESPGERKSMRETARITAEAMRTGKMPSQEVMRTLPEEQQEAIRRAVQGRQSD